MPKMCCRILRAASVALLVGVSSACSGGGAWAQSNSSDTFRNLKLFGEVFERVRNEYVEEVSDKQLIESAINGMLTSLDPHSSYLDTSKLRDMQVQTKGEFGGLGIEVTMENGLIKVVSPIDDTPAFKAGIQSGDLITHIDGDAVLGLTLNEAVEKMRGPVDSKIKLRVLRQNKEDPIDVTLSRAVIKISPVKARVESHDVGYVRVTSFNEQTNSAMRDGIEKIKGEMKGKMRGLVLDLRNNPGGLLDQAVAVSDAFIDQGEIVSTRGRREDSIQRYNARPGDVADGLPIVVLINGGSASASEIVAGALQDHRRAIVMGTQSFGKGSVQTIMPVDSQAAIRLTTARYYTPAGTSIQAKGITPDIEVHQAKVDTLDDEPDRREADLRGRLKNDQEVPPADAQPPTNPDAPALINKNLDAVQKDNGDETAPDGVDYQLARAVDLLRGIALYEARNEG